MRFVLLLAAGAGLAICQPDAAVPFVGCPSGGQVGSLEPANGKTPELHVTSHDAGRLAFYSAGSFGILRGVLAPRGWHCFGAFGSGAEEILVSPEPVQPEVLFSQNWKGFSGPAIDLTYYYGETSGRLSVAKIAARVFPAHKNFVESVIESDLLPASDFAFRPYPEDKLKYKSNEVVEYETPVGRKVWGHGETCEGMPLQFAG